MLPTTFYRNQNLPHLQKLPRPKFVLSFGALDDLLFRAADVQKRGGVSRWWLKPGSSE